MENAQVNGDYSFTYRVSAIRTTAKMFVTLTKQRLKKLNTKMGKNTLAHNLTNFKNYFAQPMQMKHKRNKEQHTTKKEVHSLQMNLCENYSITIF
ncbi:hypothetical protein [Bartonella refiksaydamii]|uniref:hypothetical protein n=1 Tax=Bartonella refiksaydamii TaxID=2654951 RepID=UPI0012EBC363|nr:hypothetical protein [Bartonella refiksaydamii]